jgi:hypothetical protein
LAASVVGEVVWLLDRDATERPHAVKVKLAMIRASTSSLSIDA